MARVDRVAPLEDDWREAIDAVVEHIRRFEALRCGLDAARIVARNDEAAARLERPQIDLDDLDLT